jgi:hypothetical protein
MINLIVTIGSFTQDGVSRTPTNTFEKGYLEKVDDQFFHIELDGSFIGFVVSELSINGFIFPDSDAAITELRSIRGWTPPVVQESIDFVKRQSNVNQMNSYMDSLRVEGLITQANFDLFLADTATNVQSYLSGGSRLITWIETVNRNGYNATTVGFKTKTAYRGALVNGVYSRAEMILSILNNL